MDMNNRQGNQFTRFEKVLSDLDKDHQISANYGRGEEKVSIIVSEGASLEEIQTVERIL